MGDMKLKTDIFFDSILGKITAEIAKELKHYDEKLKMLIDE